METVVSDMGARTTTAVYRIGEVEGPFRGHRRGKPSVWVVRISFGPAASIMQDRHFSSRASAVAFWQALPCLP